MNGSALAKDQRFDGLFIIDGHSRQTKIAHGPSIIAEDSQGDSGVKYRRTILSIVNHFAILPLPSMSDPIVHPSRVAHVRWKPI